MKKRHIVLTGPRGSGKSSLIAEIIREADVPVYGFITDCLPADQEGFHPIYIHPAGEENWEYEERNRIGSCDTRIHNIRSEIFDTVGTELIRSAKPDGILIMDELGFMEEQSDLFMQAVEDALDGDVPVLAACKSREDIPFLCRVRAHPAVRLLFPDPDNWETIRTEIRTWLSQKL